MHEPEGTDRQARTREAHLMVTWMDGGRDPQCAPDPAYPAGIDLDVSNGAQPTCWTALPYPAIRCGFYLLRCEICDQTIICTTAGRPDDPRSIKVGCLLPDQKERQ